LEYLEFGGPNVEASETNYWLEIVAELNWIENSITEELINEANELLAIFTSLGKSLKLQALQALIKYKHYLNKNKSHGRRTKF
jgi:hypothetical protein